MRSATINIRNGEPLEVFVKPLDACSDGWEVWIVGTVGGKRFMFDHLLTHHHLESRLCYAIPGDILWRCVDSEMLPTDRMPTIKGAELALARGCFRDSRDLIDLFHTYLLLPLQRKVWSDAKKLIVGDWTDGVTQVSFRSGDRFQIETQNDCLHRMTANAIREKADKWSASKWMLWVMNSTTMRGERLAVWHVSQSELHLLSQRSDSIAHVYRRMAMSSQSML